MTKVCPRLTSAGGCSLTSPEGTIHETAGKVPLRACSRNLSTDWMLPNSPSFLTVSKYGKGFRIPGVFSFC
ncbi:MAG: hypothetical protein ABSF64_03655 [Bryobacteraceae bacterium]